MILKILPYLLVIFPIISFFIPPEKLGHSASPNAVESLIILVFTLPWWGKIISMLVGISWIATSSEPKK